MYSLQYYNAHADEYCTRVHNIDMSQVYDKFLTLIPLHAKILDMGCGSGRDSKYFINAGYDVLALDGSIQLVQRASQELGQEVLHMIFEDMTFTEKFDGVWACASLLHIPYDKQKFHMECIHRALKPGGIFYASYKYGDTHYTFGGREFFNMTQHTIVEYTRDLFDIICMWETPNISGDLQSRTWLNFLAMRKSV